MLHHAAVDLSPQHEPFLLPDDHMGSMLCLTMQAKKTFIFSDIIDPEAES